MQNNMTKMRILEMTTKSLLIEIKGISVQPWIQTGQEIVLKG